MASNESGGKIHTLLTEVKQYIDLNIEYARLTVAEKMAVLLTTVATVTVTGVLALLIFFFVSIAAVHWLALAGMSVALAYSIMAAFYVLLLALLWVFRRQLVINPIVRFVTKLLMK